jgi:hypothetical protein
MRCSRCARLPEPYNPLACPRVAPPAGQAFMPAKRPPAGLVDALAADLPPEFHAMLLWTPGATAAAAANEP